MSVFVRDATTADLTAMLDIHNERIASTTDAWTEHLQTIGERRAWFDARSRRGFPVLVAVDEAEAGAVVGMTSFGDFRDSVQWPGYRFTAELSIHVRGDRHREGIGRMLMDELVAQARARDIHVLVAGIDSQNLDSIAFHEQMGFVETARMPETGFKFGRRLDLVLMQRTVSRGAV